MPKRTIIYIDGYNLYYSRLRGTPYKWVDIVTLFRDHILGPQDPDAQVIGVKFFTAPVKASYARHGVASEIAQTQYHRALMAKHSDLVEIIKGFHVLEPSTLPTHVDGVDPSKAQLSKVWLIEEKQTDVNLALEIYRDALLGHCDQQLICSNDSDLEPALRRVREDRPHITLGLVIPLPDGPDAKRRVPNKRLTARAHWVRHHIRDDELAQAQLPINVPTRKKPASKPAHW